MPVMPRASSCRASSYKIKTSSSKCILSITGKSDVGKTTLLNRISGVSELTSVNILFHGAMNHPDFLSAYQPVVSKKRAFALLDLVEITDLE
jgi:ABC-type sugar transport system ATPase subunit